MTDEQRQKSSPVSYHPPDVVTHLHTELMQGETFAGAEDEAGKIMMLGSIVSSYLPSQDGLDCAEISVCATAHNSGLQMGHLLSDATPVISRYGL